MTRRSFPLSVTATAKVVATPATAGPNERSEPATVTAIRRPVMNSPDNLSLPHYFDTDPATTPADEPAFPAAPPIPAGNGPAPALSAYNSREVSLPPTPVGAA